MMMIVEDAAVPVLYCPFGTTQRGCSFISSSYNDVPKQKRRSNSNASTILITIIATIYYYYTVIVNLHHLDHSIFVPKHNIEGEFMVLSRK